MLLFGKERTLLALEHCAENGLDKDYIILKLQKLVDNGDATIEEVQCIVDIINPPSPVTVNIEK